MKKLYFSFIILVNFLRAQNFPYLNASTGNPNFFTDKDTNMYFIHGNRLAKVDKNFNPVWVNTYGSLNLKNILLSKTGSMYFIADYSYGATIIGKIEPGGNVSWMKSTNNMTISAINANATGYLQCAGFFMDSANNLILSGSIAAPGCAALIKMDTLGNILKARSFNVGLNSISPSPIKIINAINGIINITTKGGSGPTCWWGTLSYSDVGDSVISVKSVLGGIDCLPVYKSKVRSDIFYLIGGTYDYMNNTNYRVCIGKYTFNTRIWYKEYAYNSIQGGITSNTFDEDESGNLFVGVRNTNFSSYHGGFIKMDSSGVSDGSWIKYFNGYNGGGSASPNDRVNVIYNNHYFMNVTGGGFSSNPLVTETITPSLSMNCSNVAVLTDVTPNGSVSFQTVQKPAQYIISTLIMPNLTPTVTAVPGFSFSQNFCMVLSTPENNIEEEIKIYPNPGNDKLFISKKNSIKINGIILFDVNGRKIINCENSGEINTSGLSPGIYLIRIVTDKGIQNKKFVKE